MRLLRVLKVLVTRLQWYGVKLVHIIRLLGSDPPASTPWVMAVIGRVVTRRSTPITFYRLLISMMNMTGRPSCIVSLILSERTLNVLLLASI